MTADERRWEEVWVFLSLDITRGFWRDLWLLVPESVSFQAGLRQQLIVVFEDKIEYASNYGAIQYRLAEWFTRVFGQAAFDDLAFWVREVFETTARRRQPKRQWATLVQRLADPHYEAPEWIKDLCRALTKDYRRGFDSLKVRVDVTRQEARSDWDAKTLSLWNADQPSVQDLICLVCWSNVFVGAWEQRCAELGYLQLAELYRNGQRIAEAPEIQLKRGDIAFPGAWRFAYASYLNKLANAGVTSGRR